MDQVFTGDCLEIMRQFDDALVDMVYLDPPFFTQKTHSLSTRDFSKTYQFDDVWASREDYLRFLEIRLHESKRLMKPSATLFFHCDRTASHHIRLLLDGVFGEENFLSEIIWSYRRWSSASKNLLNAHQTIYMYAKTPDYKFKRLMMDYSKTTNLDQILQKRERNEAGKAVYAADENGDVILNGAKAGVPLSDVWEIPFLNPKARERVGYPTQKPILLLERIIEITTDEVDLVFDPFCGSGTTLVAASLMNRRYIGIDVSSEAVDLARTRLQNPVRSDSELLKLGHEAYDNLPETVKNILAGLPIKFVQRNAGIDAIYDEFVDQRPVLIRVQRHEEPLHEAAWKLLRAGQKKQASLLLLIQTNDISQTAIWEDLPSEVMVIPATHFAVRQIIEKQASHEL
jgi:site-specific DNA-methyltransferase (adenine-specific)